MCDFLGTEPGAVTVTRYTRLSLCYICMCVCICNVPTPCLSSPGRSITDYDIKQLLRILVKALERFTDMTLIEAIIMCLTRVQPQLRSVSRHRPIVCNVMKHKHSMDHLCTMCMLNTHVHIKNLMRDDVGYDRCFIPLHIMGCP